MELVVRKNDLLRELQLFQGIVERKNTMPVLANVDFGHTSPQLTLPLGALARLDPVAEVFEVLEGGVSQTAAGAQPESLP